MQQSQFVKALQTSAIAYVCNYPTYWQWEAAAVQSNKNIQAIGGMP